MRYAFGIALFVGCVAHAPIHAEEPKTEREILLDAVQKQFRIAATAAEPSIACIIVSRSEHYPKIANSGDVPGKLGEFDRKEFLKNDSSPERTKLADWLDLTNERLIPDHGYVGGVVIDPSGLVLTPYHVIEGATKIYVFVPKKGGLAVGSYADIHAADARSDLAVLKLIHPPAQLKAIAMAEVRTADRGDRKATMFKGKIVGLMAFTHTSGSPLEGPGVSFGGGITNIRYRLAKQNNETPISDNFYKFGSLLEHDVKLNAAVPGGVLINLAGEMVGLTTSTAVVYDKELGPGYAIPTDENVRRVIDTLRRGEEVEYGFLGISLMTGGNLIQIREVMPHGPAEIAGLRPGDFITRINDIPVGDYADLLLYTGSIPAGTKVKLTLLRERQDLRERQELVVHLALGKFRHFQPFIASVRPNPIFGLSVDHLSVLTQQKVPPDGFDGRAITVTGVCVREVAANSPAANKFKTLGDNPNRWIITQVNGTPITTPAEFYTASKGQPMVKLTIRDWSETKPRELTLP